MKKKAFLPIAEVVLAGILWGIVGVFIRYFNTLGLSSADIALIRVFVGSILLFAALLPLRKKYLHIRKKDVWIFAGAGIASIVFFQVCYFTVIRQASLSIAAVLLYTSPVFVMLLSALFFRERITARKMFSALLAILGCALASGIVGSDTPISLSTLLLGLGSGFGYALYSVFARAALNRNYSSLTVTAYSFLFASLPLLFLADFPRMGQGFRQGGAIAVLMALLIAGVSACLPYLLYTHGLSRMESGKAAVTVAVEPVVATLVGVIAYREAMSFAEIAGTILVIAAIMLIGSPPRKK